MGNLIEAAAVIVIFAVAALYAFWPRRKVASVPKPPKVLKVEEKAREWMIWIGDGMAPAGPHLIGSPVDFHGRKGRVVAATALQVQIEWDD